MNSYHLDIIHRVADRHRIPDTPTQPIPVIPAQAERHPDITAGIAALDQLLTLTYQLERQARALLTTRFADLPDPIAFASVFRDISEVSVYLDTIAKGLWEVESEAMNSEEVPNGRQ